MRRLYEVQVQRLGRRVEEEREGLRRERQKGEEERRVRREEEGEERRGAQERAMREVQAVERQLGEATEAMRVMQGEREEEVGRLRGVVEERERQLREGEAALRERGEEVARLSLQLQRVTAMRAADLRLFHSQVEALHDLRLSKRKPRGAPLPPHRSIATSAPPSLLPSSLREERRPPLSLSQLAAAVHV